MNSNDHTMDNDYPNLVFEDLTEQVHRILKERILKREIKPGQQISVPDVARALNVSRTPVTDALKRLAAEGLVVIKPRVGTFVTELTERDVAELFDICLMMELHAAEVILKTDRVDQLLADSTGPLRAMDEAIQDTDYRDYDTFITNDRELHLSLVRAANNSHLLRMYTNLNLHVHAARAYYVKNIENATEIQRQHKAIIEAFRAHDADQVQHILTLHITDVKERILNILDDLGGAL
jgi:DNA-binding GntR family transcriptional regulator